MLASNSLLPLQIDQAVDPRINLLNKRYYSIYKAAQNNLQLPLPASGLSDSSLSFTNPFTPSNILDKRMTITVQFSYAATSESPAAVQLLNIGTYDCPRDFPIQKVITQLSSQVNTTSFTLPTNDVISGITAIRTKMNFRDKILSSSPAWPDQYQEYSQGALSNRSPMGAYGDNPAETLRGGFPNISVLTNTTSAATWLARFCELIMLSPYESSMGEGPGFSGVTTNSWTLNLGDLTRSWSHMDAFNTSGSPPWTTFTASLASSGFAPTLNYNILVPHLIPALPSDVFYPLVVVDRFTTPISATSLVAWNGSGGADPSDFPSTTVSSNMVNLSFVPSMLVIYAREGNQQLTAANLGYTKSDTFLGIRNINITFNTQSGILNNAIQQQLYEFSVDSGLEMSWPQFYRFRGSVLALKFGAHIPLINPDLSPGCRGNFNLQISATVYNSNQNRAMVSPALYVLPYYEGTIVSKPGVWVQQQGVVSRENVLEVSVLPATPAVSSDEVLGGGPFDFLKSIYQKVAPFVEQALPVARALAPVLGPLVGLGLDGTTGAGLNRGASTTIPQIVSGSHSVKSEMKKNVANAGGANALAGRLR